MIGTLAAGDRLGAYEIVALVGAGGMGEVYKARDTRLDRTVAIKVLPGDLAADPELRARDSSARRGRSRRSRHPHICAIYDVGRHDGDRLPRHGVSRGRDAGAPRSRRRTGRCRSSRR